MGQHRLQPLMSMGAKHPHLNNAAYIKKLLIWSFGIVVPFLVLFCIFPSGASVYKPSYNRIIVSQLQIPSSRTQSGSVESKLSSDQGSVESKLSSDHDDAPLSEEKPPSKASDDDDDDGTSDDVATNLISKDENSTTVEEISSVDKADSLPKAIKKQHISKETAAPSITEVDHLSSSKATKQNHEAMIESLILRADEGDQSSSKAKKKSEGGEEKKHNDGHEGNSLPKKAKKQNDEDDDSTTSKAKKQKNAEKPEVPSIDVELDPSSKKAKKQTPRDDEEPEINAFMIEKEVDEQNANKESKKKNSELNAESDIKKSSKKGKAMQYNTEEMPELDDELSITDKKEAAQADVEIKKSTKKAKTMDDTDETELNVEDSKARKRKADQHDEDSSTAKSSKKGNAYANELEEENFSILGKESSLDIEEDPTSSKFTNSKQSSRKAMGMSYNKDDEEDDAEKEVSFSGKKSRSKKKEQVEEEEDGFSTQMGKKAKSFAKLGKSSDDDGERSSGDNLSSDLLFLKRADEEAFLSEATNAKKNKKKKVPSGSSDLDENSPVEAFPSSRKSSLKKVSDDFDEAESEDRPTKFKPKYEKDVEFFKSSTYDEDTNFLEKDNDEQRPTKANKKKKQMNASKKLHDADLGEDIEQQFDDSSHVNGKARSFNNKKSTMLDVDEEDGEAEEGKRKLFKKKTKDAYGEEEYSIIKQKHGDYMESFGNPPYKYATARSIPSSKDDSDESSSDFTRKRSNGSKKVRKNDLDSEIGEMHNEETSNDDSMDHSSSIVSKALSFKGSMSSGNCRYFKGRWAMDSNYSPYVDSTCPWKSVNDEQRCKITKKTKNWRWQPIECNMKRFRATAFLKLMQGKSMAFVGDKMVKAQLKSLVCLLAEVETPSLLYDDKSNQSMSWYFSSSNVTFSLIWSPYLVQQTSEDQYSKLWLDKLDTKWAEMVPTLDALVLGVGADFARPSLYTVRNSNVGCYSCQSLSSHIDITNLKEISLYSGFRATMRSSIMGIGALPGFSGIVLFLQPFGFEGNGSYYGVSLKMKDIQDQELKKARTRGSIANQSKMEVLHTNLHSVSNYDPMKGLYSPSCLIPSPLADTWNQVLQHTLTRIFTLELDI